MVTGVSVDATSLPRSPSTATTRSRPSSCSAGIKQHQIYYLLEHHDRLPGRPPRGELAAQVPVPVARGAGARLRRPDLARGLQGAEEEGLPAERLDRPVGDRAHLRHVPARARRHGAADGRLARAAEDRRRGCKRWPQSGETLRLTLDINLQRAAERALTYGIHLAHASPDGQHADGGAIVALDPRNGAVLAMASNPTYKPSLFAGRKDPTKLAPRDSASGRPRQLPGAQPRDRGRLSAGLDVQAGDRARGDAGAPAARRTTQIHCTPDLHRLPGSRSTTGRRTSTSRWT